MKKRFILIPALLIGLVGTAYALKRDEVTFTRYFQLDKVDISIISDGDLENVLPQNNYEYHVALENHGQPCFVRIKNNAEHILVDTNWKLIGDYYYYQDVVDEDETIDFTTSITTGEFNKSQDDLVWLVEADAIQAKNFDLNLEKENPFDGQEILSFEGGERQ